MGLEVRALNESTWGDFAGMVERHGGVWGGCWCIGFHLKDMNEARAARPYREAKKKRVREGRAHAALVYDGDTCVGWCQFGPTDELPGIKHKKVYQEGLTELPDWRITCFFVDKMYRKQGVARVALRGALEEIERLGGGTVESYPEDVEGRKTSSSFLYNGTVAMFEREGFRRIRQLGKNHWVVSKVVGGTSSGVME